jgi:hypothetical protein
MGLLIYTGDIYILNVRIRINSILSETYFYTTPTLLAIQKWTSAKMMRQLVIDQS